MKTKRRFVRANDNIYEVVKKTKDFFIVKDRRVPINDSSYKLSKEEVLKFGSDYVEDEKVRPLCQLFLRTYNERTSVFGYPVIDIETSHVRISQEQDSQKRSKGKYTEVNKFDLYGAIIFIDSENKPQVKIISKMNSNGDFELLEEDKRGFYL